jgi:exodeoxyribonuclease V alpha subunit
MNIEDIKRVKTRDGFQDIDLQFADFLIKKVSGGSYLLYLAAALSSYALRNSHLCINLSHLSGKSFPEYKSGVELDYDEEDLPQIILPSLDDWVNELKKYPKLVSFNERTPLIFDNHYRLYLHRYWAYERNLAELIRERCCTDLDRINYLSSGDILEISKYFGMSQEKVDWQQVAVFTALVNKFALITGGPGTGKTTVVSAILAMHIDRNPDLRIAVCAPTGKAASRLKESIRDEIKNLRPKNKETAVILEKIDSCTIHRLLGVNYLSPHFKHNKLNPISADLIVVDEASMISQSLMTKLMEAIPASAGIIMLGDKEQLASVEEGAVLADFCDASEINHFSPEFCSKFKSITGCRFSDLQYTKNKPILSDCVVELQKSQRFDDKKGIGQLKKAIGDVEIIGVDAVWDKALKKSNEFSMKSLPEKNNIYHFLREYIDGILIKHGNDTVKYKSYLNAKTKEDAYSIFTEFKILCSHRNGRSGVKNINRIVHELLIGARSIAKGVPVMITENDNQMQLYNGDIGLIWPDENNKLKAFFPEVGADKLRGFSIPFLPAYEEVFAMTIHKSQGSGFQNVLMILPDKDSPILTRELVYTGLTRAKKYCEIWSDENVFKQSVLRKTIRFSGLKDRLIASNL